MKKINLIKTISIFISITFCHFNLDTTIKAQEIINNNKIFTRDTVNEIAINEGNKYGSPNKYWNENTGVFIIPDGYVVLESFDYSAEDKKQNIIIDKVKHIIMPDTIKSMKPGVFGDTSGLMETIRLSNSLEKIEDKSFSISLLKELNIPKGVKIIGKGALSSTQITELTIPDNVIEIQPYACCQCVILKKIRLPKGLKIIDKGVLSETPSLEEIVMPDALEEIEDDGITGGKFKELKFSKSLKKIGKRGLWMCNELENLEIPGVISLGDYVLSNCNKLQRLVVSKTFFTSEDISKKAFDASDVMWTNVQGEAIKDNTIDVYVEDGIDGLDIEALKQENKWIRSIQALNSEAKTNKPIIPNTGLDNTITTIFSLLLVGLVMEIKIIRKNIY